MIGVIALVSGKTNELITLSALGAIVMYIASMLSLFRLRRCEPTLSRPFRAPWYPVTPLVALGLSILSLAVIVWFNVAIALIFAAGFAGACAYFRLTGAQRLRSVRDEMLALRSVPRRGVKKNSVFPFSPHAGKPRLLVARQAGGAVVVGEFDESRT